MHKDIQKEKFGIIREADRYGGHFTAPNYDEIYDSMIEASYFLLKIKEVILSQNVQIVAETVGSILKQKRCKVLKYCTAECVTQLLQQSHCRDYDIEATTNEVNMWLGDAENSRRTVAWITEAIHAYLAIIIRYGQMLRNIVLWKMWQNYCSK